MADTEVYSSPLSRVKVTNAWRYTPVQHSLQILTDVLRKFTKQSSSKSKTKVSESNSFQCMSDHSSVADKGITNRACLRL
jgi:hypothetical protein